MAAAPSTFLELYQDPEQDPYDGDYSAVMGHFTVAPLAAGWSRLTKLTSALGMDPDKLNAYVGLFPYPGEDAGRTRLLHAPVMFPMTMGRATAYDNEAYAFLDEAASGTAQTVLFSQYAFALTTTTAMYVPKDISTAVNAMAGAPGAPILDALVAGADTKTIQTPEQDKVARFARI